MRNKVSLPVQSPRERAFLVGVEMPAETGVLSMEESLTELALLAQTAGLDVAGETSQRLRRVESKTLIGTGKVAEVRALAEETLADVVIFDSELSPRHQRELEEIFGEDVRILDRTAIILDIFSQHARTREGALQVELAQYEYRLPRLTRAWTHLARQAGGGGGRSGGVGGVGLRGPGETQLEVDKREISRRMATLRRELEKVRQHRQAYRSRRRGSDLPTIALVGYTNAGKSTLLNRLAGSEVLVADQLFATLDPTTRRVQLASGQEILLTDTVGFIQKLPTMLVAAFRATLEEIAEADLLLHVVDITHANASAQADSVQATLEEIHVGSIPMVTALNKIDRLADRESLSERMDDFERAVPISAATGEGVDSLEVVLDQELLSAMDPASVQLPYDAGRLIHLFHEKGVIDRKEYTQAAVVLEGRIPRRYLPEFERYRLPVDPQGARTGSGSVVPPSRE
ncbi:MAG: GTPase HflX [Anaerolineales bacterium]